MSGRWKHYAGPTSCGDKRAKETGLAFTPTRDGDRIEGVYRKPLRLASGKFAVIEKSKEFTLVHGGRCLNISGVS